MQRAVISELHRLAKEDEDVVYLSADNGTDYDFLFQREFPDRYYNVGIAEQNMIGVASGLAGAGKKAFAISAGPFLAYRAFEFVRNDMCMQERPVVLIGTGSGLSVGMLGPTHHTTEDIAVLRSVPGLRILSPSCPREAAAAVRFAYGCGDPAYIRLGMNGEPDPYSEGRLEEDLLQNVVLRKGRDVALIATGSIASEVLAAAELLEGRGPSAAVVNVRSLKPFDASECLSAARSGIPLAIVEEHGIAGGLGGAVAEALADAGCCSAPLLRIGLDDSFAKGYGTEAEMRLQNGFDAASLADRVAAHMEKLGGGR